MNTETRNARIQDLVPILREQHDAKLDCVIPATAIRSVGGVMEINGMSVEAQAGLSTDVPGRFRPTDTFDDHISEKLGVPRAYLRRLRDERIDLYDSNVNGWLHGHGAPDGAHFRAEQSPEAGADQRKFLVRTFTSLESDGIARALLSDSFQAFDYLDVVTVTLEALNGLRDSGKQIEVVGCDVSERRMVIRVACPDIAAAAPKLLAGYRSPVDGFAGWSLERLAANYSPEHLGWDASKGETPPVVFAGFEISTSETGGGATVVAPRLVLAACTNGLKITADVMRKVHLGGKLGDGQVRWSTETHRRNLELIRAMAKDTIDTCLSQEYLDSKVAEIEQLAGTPVEDPAETIKVVGKQLAFSESETAAVLADFIRGGQMTAGGVLNAVTSAAQRLDTEAAFAMENRALEALSLAAAG